MIENFRHPGLRELSETGRSAQLAAIGFDRRRQRALLMRLDALAAAEFPEALTQPGFDLRGAAPHYSLSLPGGAWRLSFTWTAAGDGQRFGDARDVDLVAEPLTA